MRFFAGNVHVSYCSQNAAWVTILDSSKSAMVISELIKGGRKDIPYLRKSYKLITWREYHRKKKLFPSQVSGNSSSEGIQSQPQEESTTSAKNYEILTTHDKGTTKQKRTLQAAAAEEDHVPRSRKKLKRYSRVQF